jgi:hypothetical protein
MRLDTSSRRSFLKAAGAGLVLNSGAASYTRILGANDRVRVGVIGFSERFRDAFAGISGNMRPR